VPAAAIRLADRAKLFTRSQSLFTGLNKYIFLTPILVGLFAIYTFLSKILDKNAQKVNKCRILAASVIDLLLSLDKRKLSNNKALQSCRYGQRSGKIAGNRASEAHFVASFSEEMECVFFV